MRYEIGSSVAPGALQQTLPALAPIWAFSLDADGTLLEIVERPELTRADSALLVLAVAGQHGVERRDSAGRMYTHTFPFEPLRRAATQLQAFAATHPGLLFENKGHSLALHYCHTPAYAEAVRIQMAATAAELGEAFELQSGKMVFEVKMAGRDKGSVIEEFMVEGAFRGRTPGFVGDELTDEYGFKMVNQLGGHAIKVGAGSTVARWRIADTRALRMWLCDWAAGVGQRAP